jgi:hypothetical protein
VEAERKAQEVAAEPSAPALLTVERTAIISKVIEEVSGAYCKKVWWADRLELMQETWTVVLEALARKPIPDEWLRGTVARIASRRMAQFLWELTCPATGARGGRHFEGVKRASELELEQQAAGVPAPDARLVEAEAEHGVEEARAALCARIEELYVSNAARSKRETRAQAFAAALRVLIDGLQSAEAAEESGEEIGDVYAETNRVKRLIVEDQQARELLEEIQDWRADL